MNRSAEHNLLAKDRERIARELHDGVIQSMYGIGMMLEGIKGDTDMQRIHAQLSGMTASINLIIDDLRAYVDDLSPRRLAERGLGPELCSLAQEFQSRTGVVASVRLHEGVVGIRAQQGKDLMQIARESLSNVSKHAAASRVMLKLHCSPQTVRLEIVDDGHGLTPAVRSEGRGLANIVHRAQTLGGTAVIASRRGRGTTVKVSVRRFVSAADVA